MQKMDSVIEIVNALFEQRCFCDAGSNKQLQLKQENSDPDLFWQIWDF